MPALKDQNLGTRSVEDVRADFPILGRRIGSKPLAYLDNAATSQKPREVLDAIRHYYERGNANVHRALHTLGEEATAAFEDARKKTQAFINAAAPAEVIFTRGTTEAINLVASAWTPGGLTEGDVILLTGMEHHSNIVPWQLAAERMGCRLDYIPVRPDGTLDKESAERTWDPRTRLVAMTYMSNVLGTINDVKGFAKLAHERGALFLVDAAQAVPHFAVDVRDLDCDFLAFSGHKMYGPMGIGVLYGRQSLLEAMPPWMGGGEMIRAVGPQRSTWNDLPWKFEAGTPNVEGAVGLGAAIDYLNGIGLKEVCAREEALGRYAGDRLRSTPGVTVFGSAPLRGAVYSFTLGAVHAHDVAQYLDREGIAVRAGHHCAQPLMRSLGVPATARASLSFYNTFSEIDRLVEALAGALRFYA
jgi:cysteine desulfurase/selenocysteine lyase